MANEPTVTPTHRDQATPIRRLVERKMREALRTLQMDPVLSVRMAAAMIHHIIEQLVWAVYLRRWWSPELGRPNRWSEHTPWGYVVCTGKGVERIVEEPEDDGLRRAWQLAREAGKL